MDNKDTSSARRKEIEQKIDDGAGCVETCEALSEIRESGETDRRQFLRNVGLSFGALTLGSGVSTATGPDDDDRPEIDTEEVRGKKRGQLV